MLKIAYIVISCRKYSDLWRPFFLLQRKFWPEINEDLFLATDSGYQMRELPDSVNIVDYGQDKTWSFNVRKIINDKKIEGYDYVFLLMEDGFIEQRVDHEKITRLFHESVKYGADFFTILNEPICHERKNESFGIISKQSAYRATATSALWRKDVLLSLLDDSESAWEFEKKGARRSEKYSNFFSCYENQISFLHMVVKGKFVRGALAEAKLLGVDVVSDRGTISFWFTCKASIYSYLRSLVFKFTPIQFHKYLVRKSN